VRAASGPRPPSGGRVLHSRAAARKLAARALTQLRATVLVELAESRPPPLPVACARARRSGEWLRDVRIAVAQRALGAARRQGYHPRPSGLALVLALAAAHTARSRLALTPMSAFDLQAALALFALSFAGGVLPLARGWSERGLHLFAALSGGIFLGLVFLHLLPEMGAAAAAATTDPHALARAPWAAALAGFLLLFFVEKIWLEGRARADQHRVVWYASYFGLVIHAGLSGIGLASLGEADGTRWVYVGALLSHKVGEAFSLATIMRLAGIGTARACLWLGLFCLVAPAGLLLGAAANLSDYGWSASLTGLACGTFFYVAACDLLPEVFHGDDPRWPKVLWVLAGVLLAGAVGEFGHTH
jgi:zinc and cadmium transporter